MKLIISENKWVIKIIMRRGIFNKKNILKAYIIEILVKSKKIGKKFFYRAADIKFKQIKLFVLFF